VKSLIRGGVFTGSVSPKRIQPPGLRTVTAVQSLTAVLADRVRGERRRRHMTIATLAERAGISGPAVVALEHARRASLDTWVAVAHALGLDLDVDLVDPRRRRANTLRQEDSVHAAMGELKAAQLQRLGFFVAIDEPYQHFQFAGRADVVAWQLDPPAMLHIENRTRFPNVGEIAGSWNAKRRWLAPELAKRLGIPGFRSETHVMACLWSGEVLHALRRQPVTFRSLAPDPPDGFRGWWSGAPTDQYRSGTLIALDPFATPRQRAFIDLETALGTARPRIRGYAEAADRLEGR